jgi:hypothetical protein
LVTVSPTEQIQLHDGVWSRESTIFISNRTSSPLYSVVVELGLEPTDADPLAVGFEPDEDSQTPLKEPTLLCGTNAKGQSAVFVVYGTMAPLAIKKLRLRGTFPTRTFVRAQLRSVSKDPADPPGSISDPCLKAYMVSLPFLKGAHIRWIHAFVSGNRYATISFEPVDGFALYDHAYRQTPIRISNIDSDRPVYSLFIELMVTGAPPYSPLLSFVSASGPVAEPPLALWHMQGPEGNLRNTLVIPLLGPKASIDLAVTGSVPTASYGRLLMIGASFDSPPPVADGAPVIIPQEIGPGVGCREIALPPNFTNPISCWTQIRHVR